MLLFFVRWPEPGRVKSRLASTLGIQEACRIHRLLAEACFQAASNTPNVQTIVCGTGGTVEQFRSWLPGASDYWLQPETGLGERLSMLFARAFDQGATSVAAIGSDAPTLDSDSIRKAFQSFDQSDVSLLPATDGGYVFVGSSHFIPQLFEGITWGTDSVLAETRAICRKFNLRVAEGAAFQDVDTEADWRDVSKLLGDRLGE